MLKYFAFYWVGLVLSSLVVRGVVDASTAISCNNECDATGTSDADRVCTARLVYNKFTETPDEQRTPAAIQDFSVAAYPTISSDGATFIALNLSWTQKWSEMIDVDGYYMTLSTFDQVKYRFILNKEKLNALERTGELVRFNYACFGTDVTLRLYAGEVYNVKIEPLPLHRYEDKEYFESRYITIPEVPVKTSYAAQIADEATETRATPPLLEDLDDYTEQHMPIHMTIIACVLSVLGMVLLVILLALSYFLFCSSISGRLVKRRRKKEEKIRTLSLKSETDGKKVVIVTCMTEDDLLYRNTALCLANALQDSGEFEVSCNLWMTQQIAKEGVALWANRVIECNDKVVLICNPTTKAVLKKSHPSMHAPSADSACYPSAEIVFNMVSDPIRKGHKFVLVCVDIGTHACVSRALLPSIHAWRKFSLPRQFPQLIKHLSSGANSKISKSKIEAMRQRVERNINAIKERKSRPVCAMDVGNNNRKHCLENHHGRPHAVAINMESVVAEEEDLPRAADAESPDVEIPLLADIQHSANPHFRTRIHSTSTETVSSYSYEDTGFQESGSKRISDVAIDHKSGARPKLSARV